MTRERTLEMVRQFPENGMKLLLQQPDNARELLTLAGAPLLDRLVFAEMVVDPTTYVSADFRHVSSDLVLRVPLRPMRGSRRRRFLSLTILIEHQSAPDRLMILRVLDYLVQIWKAQVRAWGKEHGSFASVQLQPILPVVFYTGLHRWERLGGLLDLMHDAEPFRSVTPEFQPRFVNLPETPAEQLPPSAVSVRCCNWSRNARRRRGGFRSSCSRWWGVWNRCRTTSDCAGRTCCRTCKPWCIMTAPRRNTRA